MTTTEDLYRADEAEQCAKICDERAASHAKTRTAGAGQPADLWSKEREAAKCARALRERAAALRKGTEPAGIEDVRGWTHSLQQQVLELQASNRALTAARDDNNERIKQLREMLFAAALANAPINDVRACMALMGQPTPDAPHLEDYPTTLRMKLIFEEASEFAKAAGYEVVALRYHQVSTKQDWPGMIDGIVDLLYVTYGAAVAMGIDIAPFWAAVHKANVAKVGGGLRTDGKFLKPEGWQPPNIEALLEQQIAASNRARDGK